VGNRGSLRPTATAHNSDKKDMLESTPDNPAEDAESIARRGPSGALLLCGIAVAVVIAIWFAFYFLAFLPRGIIR
jgi:hypothetical protein